jgi:hypothetical protein
VELDQYPISHGFDQSTMVRANSWLEHFIQVGSEKRARTLLVDLAQAAIADDIGNQDGCEMTFHPPILRGLGFQAYSRSQVDAIAAALKDGFSGLCTLLHESSNVGQGSKSRRFCICQPMTLLIFRWMRRSE